jgi:hypothetical protein
LRRGRKEMEKKEKRNEEEEKKKNLILITLYKLAQSPCWTL